MNRIAALAGLLFAALPAPAWAQDETGNDTDTLVLDPIVVLGQPGFGSKFPAELLPCLGCDGRTFRPPLSERIAREIGKAFVGLAIRPLFQQPRVRGEPNDEAAYYALRSSICDGSHCFDRHPNPKLLNWVPDEQQRRQPELMITPALVQREEELYSLIQ